MKDLLVTCGFPRSGNTYLNYALNLLFYPQEQVNWNRHTVASLEEANKIIVPFRNPIDSISSWHKSFSGGQINEDIAFYVRFYSAVLENANKIVFMDFDYFTKDIDYIKDKVLKNFGVNTNRYITDVEVKEAMLSNGKDMNLPRSNQENLALIKEQLQNIVGFDRCLGLYAQLKG
jgi:uncharacterized protein YqfB (UPF0267 family)